MKKKFLLILTLVTVSVLAFGVTASAYTPPAPLMILTTSVPDGTVGVPYSFTVNATGGTLPYTWSDGAWFPLPDGLSIDSATGEISGTPTDNGTTTFNVWVKDSGFPFQRSAWKTLTITINKPSAPKPEAEPIKVRDPDVFALYARFGYDSVRYVGSSNETMSGGIQLVCHYPGGAYMIELPGGCEISGRPIGTWVSSITDSSLTCTLSGNVTFSLPMLVSKLSEDAKVYRDMYGHYTIVGEVTPLFEVYQINNGEAIPVFPE